MSDNFLNAINTNKDGRKYIIRKAKPGLFELKFINPNSTENLFDMTSAVKTTLPQSEEEEVDILAIDELSPQKNSSSTLERIEELSSQQILSSTPEARVFHPDPQYSNQPRNPAMSVLSHQMRQVSRPIVQVAMAPNSYFSQQKPAGRTSSRATPQSSQIYCPFQQPNVHYGDYCGQPINYQMVRPHPYRGAFVPPRGNIQYRSCPPVGQEVPPRRNDQFRPYSGPHGASNRAYLHEYPHGWGGPIPVYPQQYAYTYPPPMESRCQEMANQKEDSQLVSQETEQYAASPSQNQIVSEVFLEKNPAVLRRKIEDEKKAEDSNQEGNVKEDDEPPVLQREEEIFEESNDEVDDGVPHVLEDLDDIDNLDGWLF